MTGGVTRGIVESMTGGIVSSTSLMANMPGAVEAAAQALTHKLAVGVHLNLTTGKPISPRSTVPSLVRPDGSFHTHAEFKRRLVSLKVSMAEMYREFSAQVEATRRMGIEPTHLDTHHHLHLWLPVTAVLLRVGRRYGVRGARTTRTMDRSMREKVPGVVRGWAKRGYKAVTAALLSTWFKMPVWRMDPSNFRARRDSATRAGMAEWLQLVSCLKTLPLDHVVEITCHPAYVDDDLKRNATYAEGRQCEVAALTSLELKAALTQAGISLITFRDL
jgi:predicted glycoside hydrolase/deacetylase ChbG (UPF0249 family)